MQRIFKHRNNQRDSDGLHTIDQRQMSTGSDTLQARIRSIRSWIDGLDEGGKQKALAMGAGRLFVFFALSDE